MQSIRDITDFIFLEDTPLPADVILLAGSNRREPALRAAELYLAGLAPQIMVSGRYSKETGHFVMAEDDPYLGRLTFDTEADFMSRVMTDAGVPASAIMRDDTATFTLENARMFRQMLEASGSLPRRALLCCQAFHARRCRMYFEYVFRDTNIEFRVCPAVTRQISRDSWTKTGEGLETVLGELRRCGEQFAWMLTPEDF